jgi:hypothetical protein
VTWRVANAEDRQRQNPDTFQIPSRRLREALSEGNCAKLVFELMPPPVDPAAPAGERMWVRIRERREAGRKIEYVGELANDPFVLAGELRSGEILVFGPEHVAGWLPEG